MTHIDASKLKAHIDKGTHHLARANAVRMDPPVVKAVKQMTADWATAGASTVSATHEVRSSWRRHTDVKPALQASEPKGTGLLSLLTLVAGLVARA